MTPGQRKREALELLLQDERRQHAETADRLAEARELHRRMEFERDFYHRMATVNSPRVENKISNSDGGVINVYNA